MSETVKTFLTVAGTVLAFEVLKSAFGYGPALIVGTSALSFFIGALWGAGASASQNKDGEQ